MFKTAKFSRISQNIVQQIRQAILQGKLKPGDRLPPEKELAEDFGVSKASLREAFRALEALGLLGVRQGVSGGAFIREVDEKIARDALTNYLYFHNPSIAELSQLRSIIEPQLAEIAALEASEEELDQLEEGLQELKSSLSQEQFNHEVEIDFHRRIAAIAKNPFICLIMDAVRDMLVGIKDLIQTDHVFSEKVFFAHERILNALRERDPQKARIEMFRHVKDVEQSLIAFKQRHSSLQDSGLNGQGVIRAGNQSS